MAIQHLFLPKNRRFGKQCGFTLVELMIVVSIVGILASLAMPIFQRYVIRSQVAEGLSLSGGAQTAVSEFYMENGAWPRDNKEAGLSDGSMIHGDYTEQVEVRNQIIVIVYGANAHANISGAYVTLSALENEGSVGWTCSSRGTIPPEFLPEACRQETETTP